MAAWCHSGSAKSIFDTQATSTVVSTLVGDGGDGWLLKYRFTSVHYLPRSACNFAFLSGVKGKVPAGASARRNIILERSKTVRKNLTCFEEVSYLGVEVGHLKTA